MDNDFEREFTSDEEFEEVLDSFDRFIEDIRDQLEEENNKVEILNPIRIHQMRFAYAALKYILKNSNAKLSYMQNEPYKSMGSISAEGRCLSFNKPEWFARVAEFADNMDVYPLAKNRVRMTFTFHCLTVPIE